MEKFDSSAPSTQPYGGVKDEDYEETVCDESGNESFATYRPSQSRWYSPARFLICRQVLAVHFMWLLFLIFAVFGLRFWTSSISCTRLRLPSDEIFGDIPYRVVTWEENKAFVESDPMDGKHWNHSREFGVSWTPWDDIHPGAWIKAKPSSQLGIPATGIPLREFSRDQSWETDEQGFSLSMHHQIHCMGWIKHVLILSEQNEHVSYDEYRHIDHCVEYIRQAIMCHGDLTLEPLKPAGARAGITADTWASKHLCRDWNALKEVVWKHAIRFDEDNFVFVA
ncbi:hypothetical protein F5Y16DRAFT_415973 [Xylariaceae sp. FL0255]|nr:hypothetical protein F5Y16DRAFT_415973 [Xylariaceae sp. FL0255]